MRIQYVRDSAEQKLATGATRHCSDVELLACLAGAKAPDLLRRHGSIRSINRLAEMEVLSLLGKRNGQRLLLALELGRRIEAGPATERVRVEGPADVYRLMKPKLAHLTREEFHTVLLDARHRVLGIHKVAEGGLASCAIMPRDVFEPAIRAAAPALVFVHNHPSGDPTPSGDDVELTTRLAEGARVLGISVLDHVVVGESGFASLSDLGKL